MSSNALVLQQSNIIPFPTCEAPVQGKSNEWYTPSKYIEAARKVMGSIDLDPASCELANRTVRAKRYFTEKENGLSQEWYGNVWLNPPYSSLTSGKGFMGATDAKKGPTGDFINKLVCDFEIGKVKQATVCVNADVVRNWFQQLWPYILCFSEKKIHFNVPGSGADHHFFGTCFVYLGTNEQAFIDIFRDFGPITKMIAGPRHETVQARLWGAV